MHTSPYKTLRDLTGNEPGWTPDWQQHLEVRQIDGRTVYISQPDRLDAEGLNNLTELTRNGWEVVIDGPRLGRIRVSLTQADH